MSRRRERWFREKDGGSLPHLEDGFTDREAWAWIDAACEALRKELPSCYPPDMEPEYWGEEAGQRNREARSQVAEEIGPPACEALRHRLVERSWPAMDEQTAWMILERLSWVQEVSRWVRRFPPGDFEILWWPRPHAPGVVLYWLFETGYEERFPGLDRWED